MDVRLVAYDVGGARRGVVDAPLEVTWHDKMGDIPTLQATWSEAVEGHDRLAAPCEVAIEHTQGDGWAEPRNARMVVASQDWDRRSPTLARQLNLAGVVSLLGGGRVWTNSLNTDGKRQFTSQTPGAIMATLLQEAQGRGCFPGLSWDFTAEKDSDGADWPMVVTRAYAPSLTLWSVLSNLFDTGMVDFWCEGRTLRMSPPAGRDLTTPADPVWIRDQQTPESPESESWTDLADHGLLIGDEGFLLERSNPSAVAPLGRREVVVEAGGVSDPATATQMLDHQLLAGGDVARSYTREWTWTPETRWMPARDFRAGDWILVDTVVGPRQRMRVADYSLRTDGDGRLVAFCTVGTVQDDLLSRLAKRQKGIEGGAGVAATGRATPQTSASAVPKAPTAVLVSPAAYIDAAGMPRGSAAVSWQQVTQSTADAAMEIDLYRVWVRPNTPDGAWVLGAETTGSSATVAPLPVDSSQVFAVVTRGSNGRWGGYSQQVTVTIPDDTTAPPVPSTPTVASSNGYVTVAWDKLSSTGGGMPTDFDHCDVLVDGVVKGSLDLLVPSWQMAGSIGASHNIQLKAVDRSGNVSDATGLVSVTVKSALDDQVVQDALADATRLMNGSLPDTVIPPIYAEKIAVGSLENLVWDGELTVTDLTRYWESLVASVSMDTTKVAPRNAVKVVGPNDFGLYNKRRTPVQVGDEIHCELSAIYEGPGTHGSTIGMAYKAFKADGSQAAFVYCIPAQTSSGSWTGAVKVTDATWATVQFVAYVNFGDGSTGETWWVTGMMARRKRTGQLIVDGTITATNLAASAVTADKIDAGAVTAAKLSADALNFKTATGLRLTSPEIHTDAASDKGLHIVGNDLTAYNSSGQRTVLIDGDTGDVKLGRSDSMVINGATGNVTMRGDLRSGNYPSWPYTIIDDSLWSNMTGVRFHVTSKPGQPEIKANTVTWAGFPSGTLFLSSGGAKANNGGRVMLGESVIDMGLLKLDGSNAWDTRLRMGASGVSAAGIEMLTPGNIVVQNSTSASWMRILASGAVELAVNAAASNPNLYLKNLPVSTLAANLYSDGVYRVHRVSSLSRHKLDQQPILPDYRVLGLRGMTWVDRRAADETSCPGRVAGFVAEHVAELSDRSGGVFEPLVTRDADGELLGVAYDRVPAFLLPIIADMHERVSVLEEGLPR